MKKIIMAFLLIPAGNLMAQQAKEKADNFIKTFELNGAKTIAINNSNKNLTIKTWKNKTVQMATFIDSSNDLSNYDFDTKTRGETFKISSQLKTEPGASVSYANNRNANTNLTTARLGSNGRLQYYTENNKLATTIAGSNTGNSLPALVYYNEANGGCGCGQLTITVPENITLDIDNSNGNIMIQDNINKLILDTKNGNVNTADIEELLLESFSGNFEMGNIKKAEMDVNGSKFSIGSIGQMTLDTKFSSFEMEQVDNLELGNSQSDNFEINELGGIKGGLSFSNFKIQKLSRSADLNLNSGSFKVKNVLPSVSKIIMEGKYSELDFNLKNVTGYNIAAKTIYSTIRESGKFFESEEKEEEYINKKGNGGNTTISLKCNSCTLTFK
jgi:hypothetical protein